MENFYEEGSSSPVSPRPKRHLLRVFLILGLVVLLLAASLLGLRSLSGFGSYIDVITVSGTISSTSQSGLFETSAYDHAFLLGSIDSLIEDESNEGLLLYIDSPGGGVYESDELYLKLMEYREATGRPIYAYFGATAASGGYYIAMAAEHIVANRNCTTGSIGVISGPYMDITDLFEKLGIETTYFTSGRNKAMGSNDVEMTDEQRDILQSYVDETFEQFVEVVIAGRPNLSETRIRELADGRIYTARQAKENGLIDEIGSFEDAAEALSEAYGLHQCELRYVQKESSGIWQSLFGMMQELRPKNEMESAMELYEQVLTRTGYYCPLLP